MNSRKEPPCSLPVLLVADASVACSVACTLSNSATDEGAFNSSSSLLPRSMTVLGMVGTPTVVVDSSKCRCDKRVVQGHQGPAPHVNM